MHVVYLITCSINGKYYVGRTSKSAEQRWKDHVWSRNKKDRFHYAIKKHGRESFEVTTLAEVETDDEASSLEQLYILLLSSYLKDLGYNSTFGGDGGEMPTQETRRKIGRASSLRRHGPETRKKMSESHRGTKNRFYGKKHKPEVIEAMRKKCSEALSGEKNPWFGKTLSAEHRANISKAKTGLYRSVTPAQNSESNTSF